MQAIENEPAQQGIAPSFIEQYQQLGRLQRFNPIPLGDQRERFLALVHDMRQRGVDYTSQLSMLTLASLNRRDQPETQHSILSNLLQRSDIKEQEEAKLLLWQSRLILKLGEFYDEEQGELNKALREITTQQDTLLADLCEEEDNPFVLPAAMQNNGQETDGLLRHRLKAWSRLCFHDGNPAPGLLVTGHGEVMDLLQEVYEKLHRQSARLLVRLELPGGASPSGHNVALDEPMEQQCPSLQLALAAFNAGVSRVELEEGLEQLLKDGQDQWSQHLARHFPSGQDKHCVLDLFFFPEISTRQLCAESFGGGTLSGKQAAEEVATGCVVGLLKID